MRFGGRAENADERRWSGRQLVAGLAMACTVIASPAMAQGSTDVMRFECASAQEGSSQERMSHQITIDLRRQTVEDNRMFFQNTARGSSLTTMFVMANAGGARWGVLGPDDTTILGEFRLATKALEYGYLALGKVQASGPCVRLP